MLATAIWKHNTRRYVKEATKIGSLIPERRGIDYWKNHICLDPLAVKQILKTDTIW